MHGLLPDWLARWLGASGDADGHGAAWRLVDAWTWPAWATVVAIALVAGLVFAAYRTEIGVASRRTRALLAVMRMAILLVVLAMLARWMLAIEQTDLPTLAVVVDVSRSMDWPDGTAGSKNAASWQERLIDMKFDRPTRLALAKALLLDERRGLIEAAGERYRVELFFAADRVARAADTSPVTTQVADAAPRGDQSRLGDAVHTVLDDLAGRSVAAVVLLSDGVNTAGRGLADAAVAARRRGVPLFAVALGSSAAPRDVEVAEVAAEDVVFAGDTVYFDARLVARSLAGQAVRVTLRRADDKEAAAVAIVKFDAAQAGQQQWVHLPLVAQTPGQHSYVIAAEPVADEHNVKNNVQERSITVVKEQVRVLLIEREPRYEFRFLKHLLEREPTIEVRTVLASADREYHRTDATALESLPVRREDLFRYDVIILGDVDPTFLGASVMETLRDFVRERAGGLAFIAGSAHMPMAYAGTPLETVMPVEISSVARPDVEQPAIEPVIVAPTEAGRALPQMRLAERPEESDRIWKSLPPQFWFIATPRLKGGALPLAEHASQSTPQGGPLPLVAVLHATWPGKTLFHAIDGTYLWRTVEQEKYYARYWIQTIRFLAQTKLLGQDRRAELTTDRRQYRRGMPVELSLRFLAEQDAPPEGSQVRVSIEGGGEKRTVALARSSAGRGRFVGTVGDLPEGTYRARLSVPELAGIVPETEFAIVPPPGEMDRLQVDLAELKAATDATGGRLYRLDDAHALADDLPEGRHAPTSRLPDISLWNSWPVATVFLTLLIGEWLIRRRFGML